MACSGRRGSAGACARNSQLSITREKKTEGSQPVSPTVRKRPHQPTNCFRARVREVRDQPTNCACSTAGPRVRSPRPLCERVWFACKILFWSYCQCAPVFPCPVSSVVRSSTWSTWSAVINCNTKLNNNKIRKVRFRAMKVCASRDDDAKKSRKSRLLCYQ